MAQSIGYDKISSMSSSMSKTLTITCFADVLVVRVERESLIMMTFYLRFKYFKRRIKYSSGHPGSFNPTVITNKEAHMTYGNIKS